MVDGKEKKLNALSSHDWCVKKSYRMRWLKGNAPKITNKQKQNWLQYEDWWFPLPKDEKEKLFAMKTCLV